MKRIALFRYHNKPELCKNRLDLFWSFNPNIKVYGLYGGIEEEFFQYRKIFKDYFNDNYCIRNKSNTWKWKNGDLAIRLWYKDFGHTLDFDMLHILEWDLLILDSLESLYKDIPREGLGITGLVPIEKIEKRWFWTRNEDQKAEWVALKDYVLENHCFSGPYMGSVAPGICIPRAFLESYSRVSVPDLCNDELRMTLFAQALGFKLYDTGFFKKWFSKKEWKNFNCNEQSITEQNIMKQIQKTDGRRVFHPYREWIDIEKIRNTLQYKQYDSNILQNNK
jgi:hypothetical protein